MAVELVTIGQLTLDDLVLPHGVQPGTPGGNGMYSALGAAAWLPGKVGALVRLGDGYPAEALQEIERAGVTLMARRLDRPHLRAWLLYEQNGERRALCRNEEVLPYPPTTTAMFGRYLRAYRKLLLAFSPAARDLPRAVRSARAFHFGPQVFQRHSAGVKWVRRSFPGALISLDPSPFYFKHGGEARVREIAAHVDVMAPSREELRTLFGAIRVEEALRRLAAWGPRIAIAKLGAEGAAIFDREADRFLRIGIAPSITAVDPTGAGDSFCGAFLANYLQTGDLALSGRRAAATAASTVSAYGPRGLLQADPVMLARRAEQVRIAGGIDPDWSL